MKCNNCGADLPEDAHFCEVCGQAVTDLAQQEADQDFAQDPGQTTQIPVEQQVENPDSAKKPKRKLGLKIGIAAIIIAVVAVGAAAGAMVYKAVKKAMMNPTEYYQYVEKKNRDENQEFITDYYDTVRNAGVDKANKKMQMKFKISDTAKSLLSLSGVDFSKINDAEIEMTTCKDTNVFSNLTQLKINDESMITMKSYMDTEKNEMYLQVPELTESYLDISNTLKEMESSEENGISKGLMLYQSENYLPETSDIDAVIKRYTDIAIENAKNVKKADKKIEAKGVSQDTTEYAVTLNTTDSIKLCEDILKKVKEDKNIKNIIEKVSSDAYDSFQQGIEDTLEELKSADDDKKDVLTLRTYIDSDDTIVGRELELTEKSIVIKSLCPRDGEKFGYELSVKEDDVTYVTVAGSGKEKSGVVNGEFTVGVDESVASQLNAASYDNLLKVKVEDYDTSNVSKGEASGTVTLSTDAVAQLANYSIKIESESKVNKAKENIYLMAGKDELAAIDLNIEDAEALEDLKPSNNDTVYDVTDESDMTAYSSEMALDDFLSKLQEKTGIDFSSLAYLFGYNNNNYDDYNSSELDGEQTDFQVN